MNKWYGVIGFTYTEEVEPGIWVENKIVERSYYGDIINSKWLRQDSGNVNDDIKILNQISVVADPYAMDHCSKMAYVEFMNEKWKVADVTVQYPRLILNIGEVYNGQ